MPNVKKDNTDHYFDTLPTRLRDLRQDRGFSQTDMGNQIGVTRQAVAHYESGRNSPNPDALVALARCYGVSTDYLLGLTDDPAPKPAAVDDLGLSPKAVEVLLEIKRRYGTPPSDGDGSSLLDGYADDMILGTLNRTEALTSYLFMRSALELPETTLLDKGDGEDPLFSHVKFHGEAYSRGYAVLTAEESFRYYAGKVGEALTRWLIDTYQDQGAWNRKEEP